MAAAPFFIQGDGVNALAEYWAFIDAVGAPASHLLAEFVDIQKHGEITEFTAADYEATRVVGLYCRRLEGWAIFYIVRYGSVPGQPRCLIGIVRVGSLNPHSFDAMESEAETRLREYGR